MRIKQKIYSKQSQEIYLKKHEEKRNVNARKKFFLLIHYP